MNSASLQADIRGALGRWALLQAQAHAPVIDIISLKHFTAAIVCHELASTPRA